MGLLFNSAAVLAGSITAGALFIGIGPVWAFLLGAFILYAPLKIALPLGKSKKPVSETGIISAFMTMAAFSFWGYGALYSAGIGIISGYAYIYWWLFVFPKFIMPKNAIKAKLNR